MDTVAKVFVKFLFAPLPHSLAPHPVSIFFCCKPNNVVNPNLCNVQEV